MASNIQFNHEKLDVYQTSLAFIVWLEPIIEDLKKHRNIIDQIDRASISVVLNIAEGNGKSSKKDQNRYLEIARGSALECAACLDIMVAKKIIPSTRASEGKQLLEKAVRMLYKLCSSILS